MVTHSYNLSHMHDVNVCDVYTYLRGGGGEGDCNCECDVMERG